MSYREQARPETARCASPLSTSTRLAADPLWAVHVLQNSHDAVVSIDAAERIVWFNGGAELMFGYTADQVLGERLDLLLPERAADGHLTMVGSFCRSGETSRPRSARREIAGVRANGTAFVAVASILKADTAAGVILTAVLSDLSEQRQFAVRIDQLGRALDGSSIALFITDHERRVQYANATFSDLIALAHDGPIIGRSALELFPYVHRYIESITAALARGDDWRGRIEFVQRDGGLLYFDVWVAAHHDDVTNSTGTVVTLTDVTDATVAEQKMRRSEDLLKRAQGLTHLGSWYWDLDTGELEWSDEVFRIFGISPEDFAPSYDAFLLLVHPDDRDRISAANDAIALNKRAHDIDFRVVRPDGTIRHVHEMGQVDVGEQGGTSRMLGTTQDVTDQHEYVAAIQASEVQMRAVLNAMVAQTVVLDHLGVITAVNESWSTVAEECCASSGMSLGDDYLATTDEGARAGALGAEAVAVGLREVLSGAARRFAIDYPCPSPDGTTKWFMLSVEAIGSPLGGAIVSHSDITSRKRAESDLRHIGLHDALTGLPNRQLILDRIGHSTGSSRSASNGLAVMMLDLDRFKNVNDSLGHAMGDRVLIDVATRVCEAIRPEDTVGRLGSDEFVVVCDRLDSSEHAKLIAARILTELERPFTIAGRALHIRASIGIATNFGNDSDAETLVRNADTAMYTAKGHGGHRVVEFDDGLRRRAVDRLDVESDLRNALENGDLRLEYQPQYDLHSDQLVGFEALARWRHPTRGEIPPGDFIPIAEDSDLIEALGRWALDGACGQLAAWDAQHGTSDLRMAVNVAIRQLASHGLAESIAETLARHQLAPNRLEIEITESVFLDNLDLFTEVLRDISALGVRIALDDFGTGSASLSHVGQLPISALKIDRSFVDGLTSGAPGAQAIITSVLAIADAFTLDVIAEGIETVEQLTLLRELGCGFGQGFLLGQPSAPAAAPSHRQGDQRRRACQIADARPSPPAQRALSTPADPRQRRRQGR